MRRSSGFFTLLLIGIVIVGVGIYMGTQSHQVTYQSHSAGTIAHFLADDDEHKGYLQMDGSDDLFVVPENSFTPTINGIDTLKNGYRISFVYAPSETEHVDIKSTLGTHLEGDGAEVVQLTLLEGDNGSTNQVFTTSDYTKNPQGFYKNNWTYGGGLIALGAILAIVSLFLPKTRPQQGFSINQPGAYPPGGQFPPNAQYPPQPGQFPPQSGPYAPQPGQYPPPQQQGYPYNQPPNNNPYNQPPGY